MRALRTAVAEGGAGQGYLFSGPRGTGKTSSARILAKVLNCENPVDGEPCCECESCLAVERGTSYDVHELDAASNNGVDAMRDLIEKASLGTPGRHKVYILDEVHMLSKAAEAALLKTLEEPPDHVVFVLATTDPQKMSETIRSRTQHLQFHLLPADTLQEHVRWVAGEAGLEVSDEAIGQVISRGAGSARDALSALELVANSGGDGNETVPVGEFVEALIERDAGAALTMVGRAIALGRDPRTLTEELIAHLRNGFLSLMAPELVQLPTGALDDVTEQAQRLGPPGLVRGIEVLGEALAEMRNAPDPRVLLDVAVVQLASPAASTDVSALVARIDQLEQQVAAGGGTAAAAASAGSASAPSRQADVPRNPSTGRAELGGRARRAAAAASGSATDPGVPADPGEHAEPVRAPTVDDAAAPEHEPSAAAEAAPAEPAPEPPAEPATEPVPTPESGGGGVITAADWDGTVRPGLKSMTRALFAPAEFASGGPGAVTLVLPNQPHRDKCELHRADVEAALSAHAGVPVTVELTVAGAEPAASAPVAPDGSGERGVEAASSAPTEPAADEDVDLDDLVDAPPESVKTPIDRLAEAFPGSELVDERD